MSDAQDTPRGRRSLATRALGRGIGLERRAAGVLGLPDLGAILVAVLEDPELQSSVSEALRSDGAKEVVSEFFASPLFDQLLDELLASPGLWRVIDEIAASPAVTAAITQQGFGFADQIGQQLRSRSRRADAWAEQAARRLLPSVRRARREGSQPRGPASVSSAEE